MDSLVPVRIDDLRAVGIRITGERRRPRPSARGWVCRSSGAERASACWRSTPSSRGVHRGGRRALVATIGRALAGPIDLAARYAAEQRATALRDAFTGVISHELRTPITTIYGMSQVLRQRHETMDPETRRQSIADIEEEADRLRRLAEDLLVLSRAEGGRLVLSRDPLVIRHVVRQALDSEAKRWPEHAFSADVPLDLPLVLGEELHVGQVLQNLLGNAAKYSAKGSGHRSPRAGRRGRRRGRRARPGRRPAVRVQRSAVRALLPRARSGSTRVGRGIGLFVCRQLVEGMGGRIWARPRDGKGAEFGFWLPALGDDEDG